MNRKLAGAVVALVVVGLAVWFFALRERGGDKKPSPEPQANNSGSAVAPKPAAKPTDDTPPPSGMAPRWSLDVDPEGPLRLEGQVVDEDGHGVGDAEVWLSSVPPRSTKTEQDGSFAFDKLVGREYALKAVAGDKAGGPVQYRLTETSDPVVIRLAEAAKLVVTVVTTDEKPVEGAEVRVTGLGERSARTAADGTATLKPVHPGWVRVHVTADGYAPGHAFTQIGAGGVTGTVKVRLRKGVSVSGRVIDEGGKPIEKARITVVGMWDVILSDDSSAVITDAKGQFTIPALAPGSHTLLATDGVHEPTRSTPITVADRPVRDITITMKQGGTLAGTVVDDLGKPVPFATVRVAGDGPQMWMFNARQATSDRAGHFELTGLERTKLKARAESDTAASSIASVDLSTTPEKKDLRLVLDVKGTIAGVVVDETNEPLAEIQVNAFPDILSSDAPEAIVFAGMSSSTTDGDGRFTIRGLPDGEYRLRASRSAGGSYDWGQQGTPAKTGDKDVRIVLAANGSIVGRLQLEGGDVPKAANVQVGYQPAVPADAKGAFKLPDLAPGKYDLYVRGPEFAVFVQRDVEVKSGQPTDVGTLTLVRGRKLVGRVVDSAGNPVPGAKIKMGDWLLSMQGGEEQMETFEELYGMRSAVSDQDGRFTLVGLSKKATNVLAEHPTRGRSNAGAIPAGTEDPPPITLTLRGYGTIAGKVTSKGQPMPNVTITSTPKDGGAQVRIVQTAADGTFSLTQITEGTHVVSAMQQSGFGMSLKSTSTTVQVRAGKETTVNIDIPVGSISLTVQVKPQAGAKVDSAQVFLFRGVVAVANAKQLNESFLAGGAQGMKFWWGADKPAPEFDELVPGDYSVCTIPITGSLSDPQFAQRMQEHLDALKVYCKQVKLTPSPQKQTVVHEVPQMAPLPSD